MVWGFWHSPGPQTHQKPLVWAKHMAVVYLHPEYLHYSMKQNYFESFTLDIDLSVSSIQLNLSAGLFRRGAMCWTSLIMQSEVTLCNDKLVWRNTNGIVIYWLLSNLTESIYSLFCDINHNFWFCQGKTPTMSFV